MIVVFAMVVAAIAGVPGARQERQVYSSVVGAPLAYSASPYAYSGYYAGVPTAYSAYSPYTASIYDPLPAVRYY